MKTTYTCELCGEEFDNWEPCYDHEEGHIKPESHYDKALSYLYGQLYPTLISVEMDDGAICEYTFTRILTTPQHEPEEAADEQHFGKE